MEPNAHSQEEQNVTSRSVRTTSECEGEAQSSACDIVWSLDRLRAPGYRGTASGACVHSINHGDTGMLPVTFLDAAFGNNFFLNKQIPLDTRVFCVQGNL